MMMSRRVGLSSAVSLLALMGCKDQAEASTPEVCPLKAIVGEIRPAPGQTAEAITIKGERVDAVYAAAADLPVLDAACITTLPEGAVAFSGLTDGHAHLTGIGLREMTLNLEGAWSLAELQKRVRHASTQPGNEEVIYGRGWIETDFKEKRFPTAATLDEAVSDRPVLLTRADGHAMVVNTAALEAAGIDDDTPDPVGGRIARTREGKATGMLIDNAQALVADLMPEITPERRAQAIKLGTDLYAARGWTALQNMSVSYEDDAILKDLAAKGELKIRVMNYFVPEAIDQVIADGVGCTPDAMVCTMGMKFYVDGALGSRGALLFAPYSDEPGTLGLQLMTAEEAHAGYEKAHAAGLQVATHAIGDRGNYLVLDWYKDILEGASDHRWRIEHSQIVRPQDIELFAEGGVIASMQPSHAIGDFYFAADRLGDARLDGAYAWHSMLDAGAHVVGGSDAPVELGDPRIEIHAAFRRKDLKGGSGPDWRMEEALTPDQTVAIFTTEAAYGVFLEDELGQLAPGYRADMTVFSADPFTTPWDEVTPLMTMVNGQIYTAD